MAYSGSGLSTQRSSTTSSGNGGSGVIPRAFATKVIGEHGTAKEARTPADIPALQEWLRQYTEDRRRRGVAPTGTLHEGETAA